MKTITYNPETHVLVPRDLIADAKQIFCSDVEPNTNGDCLDVIEWFNAMMAVAPQPESSTTLEQAASHAHICNKLAEDHKDDALLFAALTDAAAIIRDLLRELRRETERRWDGNRRAAQEYVEDMREVLREAAQVCRDLDNEALAKEGRLACGTECAAAIADLAARWNVPFEGEEK